MRTTSGTAGPKSRSRARLARMDSADVGASPPAVRCSCADPPHQTATRATHRVATSTAHRRRRTRVVSRPSSASFGALTAAPGRKLRLPACRAGRARAEGCVRPLRGPDCRGSLGGPRCVGDWGWWWRACSSGPLRNWLSALPGRLGGPAAGRGRVPWPTTSPRSWMRVTIIGAAVTIGGRDRERSTLR